MSSVLKLLIPILLGLTAGVLNFMVLYGRVTPKAYVVAAIDLDPGDEITGEGDLAQIDLTGNTEAVSRAAIPWDQRAILYGREVQRPLKTDDLLLWRDLTESPSELGLKDDEIGVAVSLENVAYEPSLLLVGEYVGLQVAAVDLFDVNQPQTPVPDKKNDFEMIGPLKVLSVGRRLDRQSSEDDYNQAGEKVITVAIIKDKEGKINKIGEQLQRALVDIKNQKKQIVSLSFFPPQPIKPKPAKKP